MLSSVAERSVIKRQRSKQHRNNNGVHLRRVLAAKSCIEPRTARFTILIGSRARRTSKAGSDIDVVRVGHKKPLARNGRHQKRLVSYTDYDIEKFWDLYGRGSLFFYHMFREGRLLEGSPSAWSCLKANFRVSTNFNEEITRNRKLLQWLQRGEKFRGAIIPYLAHTCRALKNLAIFSLAQQRQYVFDKRAALNRAFPRLSKNAIDLLVTANDSFERSPRRHLSSHDVTEEEINHLRKQLTVAIQHAAR
jgi:predicted nucleotidyltransferase